MIERLFNGSFMEEHDVGMFTLYWNADGSYRGQTQPDMLSEGDSIFIGPDKDGGPVKPLTAEQMASAWTP